jgi:hypothetical protein
METESQPYRFNISLRLVHPSEDLSRCSAEFSLEPSRQWKVGDPRTTPRGNPLDGFRRESYWTAPLDTAAHRDLESALAQVAHWLCEHELFLREHASSGGSTELFIGFFLESFNTGFSLDPSLLAKYSSVGVALDFDMYGADDEPGAP